MIWLKSEKILVAKLSSQSCLRPKFSNQAQRSEWVTASSASRISLALSRISCCIGSTSYHEFGRHNRWLPQKFANRAGAAFRGPCAPPVGTARWRTYHSVYGTRYGKSGEAGMEILLEEAMLAFVNPPKNSTINMDRSLFPAGFERRRYCWYNRRIDHGTAGFGKYVSFPWN